MSGNLTTTKGCSALVPLGGTALEDGWSTPQAKTKFVALLKQWEEIFRVPHRWLGSNEDGYWHYGCSFFTSGRIGSQTGKNSADLLRRLILQNGNERLEGLPICVSVLDVKEQKFVCYGWGHGFCLCYNLCQLLWCPRWTETKNWIFFFFFKFVMEGLDKHFMVDVFIQTETKKNWTACFFFYIVIHCGRTWQTYCVGGFCLISSLPCCSGLQERKCYLVLPLVTFTTLLHQCVSLLTAGQIVALPWKKGGRGVSQGHVILKITLRWFFCETLVCGYEGEPFFYYYYKAIHDADSFKKKPI